MKLVSIVSVFLLVFALLAAAGCISGQNNGGTSTTGTSTPGPETTGVPSGVTGAANLITSPTDSIPPQNMVTVTVKEKDDITSKIPVEFDGGMGQIHVTKIDVTIYRSDGQVQSATIRPNKGESVDMAGTRLADRIVVYVTFDNGTRLKTNDVVVEYRTRR
jgi:hypothetical protein